MTTLPVTPSFRLDGRRALVTGAGRGIGRASAAALAQAGATVTLCARTEADVNEGVQLIQAAGGKAAPLILDVCDINAVQRAISEADPFHILVNNAGTNRPKPFGHVTPEDYDAVMEVNVRAAFFTAQAVSNRLVDADETGSIINLSSQMGHVGGPLRSIYCTSKFALEGLTKAMALDLAPHGIRVNTLCPTFIETPMTTPFLTKPDFRDYVLNKIKLGRVGKVEDVMGAIVFLASEAAALMTGSAVIVDGGWTAD